MQEIITYIIIAVVAALVLYRFYITIKEVMNKDGKSGGACSSCGKSKTCGPKHSRV